MANDIMIQQNVVYKTKNGIPVTDSLKIAEVFGKRHDNVLKSIRNICRSNVGEQIEQSKWFYKSSYIDINGAKRPLFMMNRDGFSLLTMGLIGVKAMQFKVGFIEQFNAMEKEVRQVMQPTAIPQTCADLFRFAVSHEKQQKKQKEFAKMKIYVSGKISGLPYVDVQERFDDAEALLTELGFEVVNPLKNGLDKDVEWEKHLCKDIEMLLGCDAIYMMDNWVDSTGASIEYDIAMRTGKDVWFESNVVRNNLVVMKIQNAIHEAMGLKFNDYITKSRKRDGFFARMIFVYHCRQNKMRLIKIAEYVKRDHSTMLHLLKKYQDDFNYNPQFREIATKVNNILNKTSE